MTSYSGASRADTIDLSFTGRAVLLLAGLLATFSQSGLAPVLPDIAAHFANYPEAGFLTRLLVSIVSVMIVVGSPFVGALANAVGQRRLLLACFLIYGVVGALGFFIENLYVILATRIVLGLTVAAVVAITLDMVRTHSEGAARNRWFGYVNVSGITCVLFLIPLSGFVASYGWQWPFLIHALALPLVILGLMGLERDTPRVPGQFSKAAGATSRAVPWRLLIVSTATGVLITTPNLYIPFVLHDIGVGDARLISIVFLPSIIGATATGVLYGAVRKRLSLAVTFIIGFALCGASFLFMGLAYNYTHMLIGSTLLGCGAGIASTNLYALAAVDATDANGTRIMALTNGAIFTGPLIGQLVLEPIVKFSSPAVGLLVLGGFAAALTLAALNASGKTRADAGTTRG